MELKENILHNLNPLDFAEGLYDAAITQPLAAVRQLGGAQPQPQQEGEASLARKAGQIAGMIVDFTLLSKASGRLLNPYLGAAAETAAGSAAKMFLAGSIYGGLLTASDPAKPLWEGRLENAGASAITFGVMGGVGKSLESAQFLGGNRFINSAIAGGAGGVADAYSSALLSEHRVAAPDEVASRAAQFAAFGAGFAAFDYALGKGAEVVSNNDRLRSARYRTEWRIRDAKIEAQRQGYATLNRFGMRHPLQSLGDLVYGGEVEPGPKAELTSENNPAVLLQRSLPKYIDQIDELRAMRDAEPDRRKSYDLHEQMGEVREDFAHRLLTLWHGTADQPGISQYSDEQLATPNIPASRVAQIRDAMQQTAHAEWRQQSPMMKALAELVPDGTPGDAEDFEIAGELGKAKERFFGYDERELGRKMGLPSPFFYIDHDYFTPVSWTPFEPTEQLPNFFHGSVSNSLDSLLRERQMLPAWELRLRGIKQSTGESADEEFPRRSVSLTRDFTEAFAYHRHSPEYLTGFPVVFGVSDAVIPRTQLAGSLEPGELLVDRINVGHSLMTRLWMRRPELTHIYAPDSQIDSLQRLLDARRVSGVRLVGFNQIESPNWRAPKVDWYPYQQSEAWQAE